MIPFVKMHGLGNDYVYIDCFRQPSPANPPALALAISDRHFGVGSDGLILIEPATQADARMRMFNADGSESEMCGNGIRCLAKYVYDSGIARKPTLTIETGRGLLQLQLEVLNGKVHRVQVDMGEPLLLSAKIPVDYPQPQVIDAAIPSRWAGWQAIGGMTCVSMGNPHVILWTPDVASVELERLGPLIERDPLFPRRINVHFVQVISPAEVRMRTWERGSGITLACGTGASAVCVAGVLTGRTQRQILAHLPGGDLELHWSEVTNHVLMTGPAQEVFRGEWPGD